MASKRICTVKGTDGRGLPVTVTVEASTVLEAAARGLEEIRIAGGAPSDLQIVEHLPGKEWKVTTDRLLKWVRSSQRDDNLGLQVIKKNLSTFSIGLLRNDLGPSRLCLSFPRRARPDFAYALEINTKHPILLGFNSIGQVAECRGNGLSKSTDIGLKISPDHRDDLVAIASDKYPFPSGINRFVRFLKLDHHGFEFTPAARPICSSDGIR
jgi:hypothetical protein